jgi:hypothetical protein
MPAPLRLTDVRNTAIRQGVSTNRFKISKEDADKVRSVEKKSGHHAAVRVLLGILFKRSA